uniref:Acid phosphatase-like protein 2 n=2 Tax=Bursaphelenchus xylophilus TaxID=6326 RepID=A0A1I7SSD4_BURXY
MRKEKCLLCALFSILFLYYLVPFEWLGPRHGKFFVHPERPAMLIERCQYLEHPVKGKEGDFYKTEWKLRGVMIVFRHGERSPLIELKNSYGPNCSPYFDIDRRAFASYTQLLASDKFREFLIVDPIFPRNFSWHPHSSKCEYGHMTAEGALQLLKLGSYLHEKYKLQGLFDDLNTIDVTLSSSMYSRTFQSAIAFTSTFFYVLDDLKNVHLKASNTTHFCLNDHAPCYCPSYDKIRKLSEMERIKEFHTRTEPRLKQRIKSLGEMVGMEKVEHPLQLFDVILGRYACRRSPFPCQADGDCLTLNDIMEVADESATIAKRMATESSKITKSMNVIEAYALFNHLSIMIQNLKGRKVNSKIVKVLSGHDITLEALVNTLNLTDRIPPHYSSRIVFELFESSAHISGENLFVRVLFNGLDQTSNVNFCSESLIHGLCPASKFESFASNGLFPLASLSDLKEIC